MNSRSWVNVGLLFFLISAALFFFNRHNTDTQERLSTLNVDEITSIHIHRDNNDISFVKSDNDSIWHMTKPYQIKAHQFRINTLLSLTQTPVDNSYNTDSLNLSDYALQPPRAHITFDTSDILFGKTNPINNKRYMHAENKMLLIEDSIYPLVSAQPSTFIDLSILPDNFNITKIQTPSSGIQLNKAGLWISSGNNPLNADQIQSLLQHWKSSQAFAVHKYMTRKKLGTIEVSSETKTLIFEITDDDPWLILALPDTGIEYHLDKSFKNILYGAITPDDSNA